MKFFFLLLLNSLMAGLALGQSSYVPKASLLKKKGQQLYLGGETFTSSKILDRTGRKFSFEDDESFNRYQIEAGGHYGATDELQFGLGARFRQNKSIYKASGQEINASSSGLQSIVASMAYGFKSINKMQFAFEGAFRYTPYTNDEYRSGDDLRDLILGDDGNEYSAGLAASYSFQSNDFISLRAGYRSPGDELSDEIYWQAEGALVWKYLAFVAGIDGVTSLGNDPFDDTPGKKPFYNTGKTSLYNSINREMMSPYLGLNIALGKQWRIEFKGSQVISGKSTDLGTAFGFQLFRRVDKDPAKRVDAQFKTYDIEANVTKVSPAKNYVVIDKGLGDDVRKGMAFDLYEFDYVGGNVLVARGIVIQSKSDTAVVKITNRFNAKKQLKEGLLARASLKQ